MQVPKEASMDNINEPVGEILDDFRQLLKKPVTLASPVNNEMYQRVVRWNSFIQLAGGKKMDKKEGEKRKSGNRQAAL